MPAPTCKALQGGKNDEALLGNQGAETMGYFKGYYFKDGILTKEHFTLATGFGYQCYGFQYRQTFKKSPPRWLIKHTIFDRISLLRKAVKNLEPLREKSPSVMEIIISKPSSEIRPNKN